MWQVARSVGIGMGYLYDNTALDKVIKGDCTTTRTIKLPDESVVETIRETIAETRES